MLLTACDEMNKLDICKYCNGMLEWGGQGAGKIPYSHTREKFSKVLAPPWCFYAGSLPAIRIDTACSWLWKKVQVLDLWRQLVVSASFAYVIINTIV